MFDGAGGLSNECTGSSPETRRHAATTTRSPVIARLVGFFVFTGLTRGEDNGYTPWDKTPASKERATMRQPVSSSPPLPASSLMPGISGDMGCHDHRGCS